MGLLKVESLMVYLQAMVNKDCRYMDITHRSLVYLLHCHHLCHQPNSWLIQQWGLSQAKTYRPIYVNMFISAVKIIMFT